MKNARKRLNTADPEIIEERILYGKCKSQDNKSGCCSIAINKVLMALSVKNYLPESKDGEDDTSMKAHRLRKNNLSLEKREQPLIRLGLRNENIPCRFHSFLIS